MGLRAGVSPFALALALNVAAAPALAQTLPSGGMVTHGQATITQSGSSLLVNQTSHNAILSWDSFSIGRGARAHFSNGDGATLNRVNGNLPSAIDGALTATGSLYLVNPAGIAVGTGGMVRTGGSFIASTHDVSDAGFLAGGDMVFSGQSRAGVVNEGVIASLGGDVVLTARRVENRGTILAEQGDVGLLAGYEVLLRDLGTEEGRFAVRLGGSDTDVVNTGSIHAANAELRANGGNVYALAGNTDGIVSATGVRHEGGRILLTAGEGGTVTATQRLEARPAPSASAPVPPERSDSVGGLVRISAEKVILGGEIDVSGDAMAGGTIIAVAREQLKLTETARLDASGSAGGLILLGGDFQGGENPAHAYWHEAIGTTRTTIVEQGAIVRADGGAGAGGNVVVWGDGHTSFAGTISATGATRGGDAEVSGKAVLDYSGFADLRGPQGFGTLLLDPYNVTISTGADSGGENSVINVTTLLAALAAGNVIVLTGGSGSQAGNITVAADLAWNSSSTLTLDAANDILIHADITAQYGDLTLRAANQITATGALDLGRFTLERGAWIQNAATLPGFAARDFRLAGGAFLRATGGTGVSGSPWTLIDIYGVQGMGTHLGGHFALGGDIDASGTALWNAGAGFAPVGHSVANSFTGQFNGRGHVISRLTIYRPGTDHVGLFGRTDNATIQNIGLEGGTVVGRDSVGGLVGTQWGGSITGAYATANVSGSDSVGGLVGWQQGGSIEQVYATGTVTGTIDVGGLVGLQDSGGSITQAYATGTVTGGGYAGGLVGWQAGGSYITQAYATGNVTGNNGFVGGLVGVQQSGTIQQAYATGDVTGNNTLGGLVGLQGGGSITQAYATGRVASNSGSSSNLGGLVGAQTSPFTVTDSFWDVETTGQSRGIGNQTGSTNGSLTTAQARSWASYTNWDFNTVWYHAAGLRPMLRAFAAPEVEGAYQVSNLYQLQLMGAHLDRHYVLTRNIDASATLAADSASGIWGAAGFAPVGTNTASFTGRFDGQGHVISGLTINRPSTNYVGLFGITDNATIRDIGLEGGSVEGDLYVGGLVGWQGSGGITGAYATGTVTGTSAVGGLVGAQASGGTIQHAYATGNVTGTSFIGAFIGGLVGGQSGGNIIQSYATGTVTGNREVGGLVGWQQGSNTVSASFWDRETTGQSSSAGSDDSFGLSTAEMQDPFTFIDAGWDFDMAWGQSALETKENNGYMMLRGVGSGTLYDAYIRLSDVARLYGDDNPTLAASGFTFAGPGTVTLEWDSAVGRLANVAIHDLADVLTLTTSAPGGVYVAGTGSLTINPRAITITADNLSRLYGEANPALTYAIGGNGLAGFHSDLGAAGFGLETAAVATSGVGNYGITLTGSNANYNVTFHAGNLAVTPRPLTITADHLSRLYGEANPALTYAIGGMGLVNGDTLSGSLATNADALSNVGLYTIGQGTLSAGANYDLTFHAGNLAVTPRAITITADNLSRLYGEANPALTYAIGGMGLAGFHSDLGAAGFGLETAAVATSGVGNYDIALTGSNANYNVTFHAGNLAVTPRALTVTADNLRKLMNLPDPALSWTITAGSLAAFDDEGAVFAGALTRDPGEGAGEFRIRQGTLQANPNYALSFNPGTLTIEPVAVTVSSLIERSLPLSPRRAPRDEDDLAPDEEDFGRYPHPDNRDIEHVEFAR